MPNSWESIKIGKVAIVNKDTYSPKEDWDYVNYLDTGNITRGVIDSILLIKNGEKLPSRARRKVKAGDIVFSTVRPNQRHYGIIDAPLKNMLVSTGFAVIRGDGKSLDTNFLYFYLTQDSVVEHLQTIGEHSTSAYPSIKPSDIETMDISLPPIQEQRAIAHILGTLDDKIELNRQMNETLEAMARAIFKSWFVDFDPVRAKAEGRDTGLPDEIAELFPDGFVDSELGEIPRGWEVAPLSELIKIIGGGTPKTSIDEYWDGNIPWFSVVDAPMDSDVFVIDTEKHITELGLNKSSTRLLKTGTTIISARGTVGKCALVGQPMAMNQSCYGILGRNGEHDNFVFFVIRKYVSDLQRSGHGSVFNTITRDTFKTIKIVSPPVELTKHYGRMVASSLQKIRTNLIENNHLSSVRDTLLPKLISGELRIEDPEKFLNEEIPQS
jgi:type I restriction enzyme S subunit